MTRCRFKTILRSVIKTRSLDNLFNFKESEKRLTMDLLPFSRFSLLSSKKVKFTQENSPGETNLPRCTFFLLNLQAGKTGKLMLVDVFLNQLTSVKKQGHSVIFFVKLVSRVQKRIKSYQGELFLSLGPEYSLFVISLVSLEKG